MADGTVTITLRRADGAPIVSGPIAEIWALTFTDDLDGTWPFWVEYPDHAERFRNWFPVCA